jgi:hypothetical protein
MAVIQTVRNPKTRHLQRAAAAATGPKTLDNSARTVRAVIATDTPVRIRDDLGNGTYGEVDEVLIPTGMVEPTKMRLRLDHNVYASRGVIGSVYDFAIGPRTIEATLRFSRAADVEEIFTRVVEGNLDSVSIGATYRMRDTVTLQPGQSQKINGITYAASDVPMRIVQRWTPDETSVVDTPADPRAVIRSKQIRTTNKRHPQLDQRLPDSGPITTGESMTVRNKRGERRTAGPKNEAGKRARRNAVAEPTTIDDTAPNGSIDDTAAFDDGDVETQRDFHYSENRERGARTAEQTRVEAQLAEMTARADRRAGTNATADQIEAARRDERQRVSRIRELGSGQPDELVTRAINDGLSPEQFGLAVLERMRGESAGHRTSQSGDGVNRAPAAHVARSATVESLQAAILLRAGIRLDNPAFASEQARVILERNHIGWLHQFNRDIAERGNTDAEQIADVGRRYSSDSAARTCERMLDMTTKDGAPNDVEEIVSRSFSSPYMPRVFGAIVSVGLVQGYMEYPDSTVGWTSEADWADFRNNQPIGIDATQGLRRHTRGTEAKDVDFADYGEAYAVQRYTGRFVLDEQDIIDDTVGANQTMPTQMGAMAARLRPDLVYALLQANGNLADGVALFHSSRGNVVTTNALSLDNLGKAEAAMASQTVKSKSGVARPLNLMAGWLVVPRALRPLGKQIVSSASVVHGNTTQTGNINPFAGDYQLRSDARLDLGVVNPLTEVKTTGSATTWYLAEQSGQQAIQIGYRRGTGRAPQIRVRPLMQPGQFGLGWDIAHDVGVGVIKAAALVRCTA